MDITVEAIYENGVLKPNQPLPIPEHQEVRITVHPLIVASSKSSTEAERMVRRSYGLLGWTGDAATLRHLAEDAEFDPQESA